MVNRRHGGRTAGQIDHVVSTILLINLATVTSGLNSLNLHRIFKMMGVLYNSLFHQPDGDSTQIKEWR